MVLDTWTSWGRLLLGMAAGQPVTVKVADATMPLWRPLARKVSLRRGYWEPANPLGTADDADQMRRRRGLALPVEVRYDRLRPENQLLLTATHRLLPFTMSIPRAQAYLQRCIARLPGVTKLASDQPLPLTPPTRLNGHYQPALRRSWRARSGLPCASQ